MSGPSWCGDCARTIILWLALLSGGHAGLQVYILEPPQEDAAHEMVLVEKESVQNGAVVLLEPGGAEKKVSKERIVAKLTPAPAHGKKVDRATAVAAINALLEAKARAVALERTLQEELEKWKKILDQMPSEEDPEAVKRAEAAFTEALQKAVPKPYDPAGAYTEKELAGQLEALEGVKKGFPSRGEEVDRQAEPWRVEREEMAAGKKKLEGRWLTPEEWEKEKGTRERAAREAFLAKLEIPEATPVLLGQGILLTAAGIVLLAVFLGASFLFHGMLEFFRHRAWWKATAWTLAGAAIIAVVGRATGLLLAPPDPLLVKATGQADPVEEVFWKYGGEGLDFPGELKVGDADLNAWFAKRLRFSQPRVTEIAVLVAEGWTLEMTDGALRLDRAGRFLGRKFVLRHEMTFNRSEEGEDIYRIEATLGRLPLPPALALRSWNHWMQTLDRMTTAIRAADRVALQRIENGAVVFSAK